MITGAGVKLDNVERSCQFSGNWLWIDAGRPYEAILTIRDGTATLEVPGVAKSTGTVTYQGGYDTLYVGMNGVGGLAVLQRLHRVGYDRAARVAGLRTGCVRRRDVTLLRWTPQRARRLALSRLCVTQAHVTVASVAVPSRTRRWT